MANVVFATGNDNKFREAEQVLGITLQREKIELDELQEMDLRVIIEHKAKQAYDRLQRPVIVEDAGLYLNQWNGFPGPFIKWVAAVMTHAKMSEALGNGDRTATWIVLYGYYDGKQFHTFEGKISGTISSEKRDGDSAWGFDPWFIPEGHTTTYAEMGPTEKLKFSARQRALLALKASGLLTLA